MIHVVPATVAHVNAMRGHIRQADVDELWDGFEVTPDEAMMVGLRITSRPKAALVDGKVLAIFGVVEGQPSVPWMIGSDYINAHRMAFAVRSRQVIRAMSYCCAPMENWVDARNLDAIQWLRWCGFQIEAPRPYGKHGLDFCRFTMKEALCVPRN